MYDSGENESKKDTGPGCCFEIRWMAGQMGNGTFFCPFVDLDDKMLHAPRNTAKY